MYISMKISTSDSKSSMEFSELVNSKEIFFSAYNSNGHQVSFNLNEKAIRELRKHLTAQIRKIKKP